MGLDSADVRIPHIRHLGRIQCNARLHPWRAFIA